MALLVLGLIISLVGAGAVLVIDKPFSPRYVLHALPFAMLLAAREAWRCCTGSGDGGARRWESFPWASALAAFGATYYTGYTRADYSAITTHIAALERHGDVDVVLLTGPWQAWYYDYYFRGEIFHHVLPTTAPPAVDEEDRRDLPRGPRRAARADLARPVGAGAERPAAARRALATDPCVARERGRPSISPS